MTVPIRPPIGRVVSPLERGLGQPLGEAVDGPTFKDLLARGLNDTSALQEDSKDMIAAFLRGEPVELHQVMAASEEAAISLELLVEIRNKLTEAYRSVMNTQT
ncbi:MAG TPA: flagellar hook-basal body complex protein FliE [Gemmatimonadales bacterium]|nr:flagellar hook-basal body complex protein FliE [Gemmatimonadales bacterium]